MTLWWFDTGPDRNWRAFEILLWTVFVACSSAYLASLWTERARLRARLFSASWLSGFTALIALAEGYRQARLLAFETLFFPFSFALSAVLLGASACGMLLGHWYLIDRDLSLQPLEQTVSLYRPCLASQAGLYALLVGLLGVAGAVRGDIGFGNDQHDEGECIAPQPRGA